MNIDGYMCLSSDAKHLLADVHGLDGSSWQDGAQELGDLGDERIRPQPYQLGRREHVTGQDSLQASVQLAFLLCLYRSQDVCPEDLIAVTNGTL